MKNHQIKIIGLLILSLLGYNCTSRAQVTIFEDGFQTDGHGTRYSTNLGDYLMAPYTPGTFCDMPITSSAADYFQRTNDLDVISFPDCSGGADYNGGGFSPALNAPPNDFFYALEDLDGSTNPYTPNDQAGITFFPANTTGYSSLEVSVYVASATASTSAEPDDFLYVEYEKDNSGTFEVAGVFLDDGAGQFVVDTDPVTPGIQGGTALTNSFQQFFFSIPGQASSMRIRVRAVIDGGSEELAFDQVKLTGIISTNDAPVLANIEPANIMYDEGDPATQITNTITASDNDDANLASATVQFISNYVNGEDVLAVSGALPGGITGSFSAATGTYTLSNSASVANYQAALRLVTYQNTNATNPDTTRRTVRFLVNDGTDVSNPQDRTIQLEQFFDAPRALPYCEDFESDGDGTRYDHSDFTDCPSSADYFVRTTSNPHSCTGTNTTWTNIQGSGYVVSEDVGDPSNPLGNTGLLELAPFDISAGITDFDLDIYLGSNGTFEDNDDLFIEYKFDNGPWIVFAAFVGDTGNGLVEDTNLDGTPDPGGVRLTPTLTLFNFSFSGSGSTLSVRVRINETSGTEDIAFDEICVSGMAAGAPPVLANIENTLINYAAGDPATQITNTITVADADDTNIDSAIISILNNFTTSEDVLALSGALPGGITAAYNSTTGQLSMSGSTTLANYQAALRLVTYQNTNALNPNTANRRISFQVWDGDLFSSNPFREILFDFELSPIILNTQVCEDFETDGQGSRYSAYPFEVQATPPADYWIRHNQSGLGAYPGQTDPYGNLSGDYLWVGEDVDATGNPNPLSLGELILQPFVVTGSDSFTVSLRLGTQTGSQFETTDYFLVQFNLDGGGWTTVGAYYGSNDANNTLQEDTDLNGSPDGDYLSTTLRSDTFNFTGCGDTLEVRVLTDLDGSEEIGFDLICVTPFNTGLAPVITSVTGEGVYCSGQSPASLDVNGDLGSATNWYWYDNIGGTLLFTGTPYVPPATPGTETYYVRAEGGCVGITAPFYEVVVVVDNSAPVVTAPGDPGPIEWISGFNTSPVTQNVYQDPTVDTITYGRATADDGTGTGIDTLFFQDSLIGPDPGNCPNLWTMKRFWIAIDNCGLSDTAIQTFTFTDLTPPVFPEPPCGSSDASASVYDDGWQGGDNDGMGFELWNLNTTGTPSQGGFFVATSTENGDMDTNSDGDIDTGPGRALGMYANSLAFTQAFRGFENPVNDFDTFRIAIDNGFVQPSGIVAVAFRNVADETFWTFSFVGGNSNYRLQTDMSEDTGIPFSDEGLELEMVFLPGNRFKLTVTRLEDGSIYVFNRMFGAPSGGSVVDKVRILNSNAGSGPTANFYINSMQICPVRGCPQDMRLACPDNLNTADVGPNTPQDPAVDPSITGMAYAVDNCGSPTVEYCDTLLPASPIVDSVVAVVERTWKATDVCDQTTICTQLITLIDTVPPVAVCADITVAVDSNGVDTIGIAEIENGSTDACSGIASYMLNDSIVDCDDIPSTMLVLTVTDSSGNQDTCRANVTVLDTIAPIIECQDVTIYLDEFGSGEGNPVINGALVSRSDNCGLGGTTEFGQDPGCSSLGDVQRSFEQEDLNGNASTCNYIQTTIDTFPPTANCVADTIYLDENGVATLAASDINDGSDDNCTIDTLILSTDTFRCDSIGIRMVDLTVIDQSGNADTCTATVTVLDTVPPVAVCQDVTVYLDDSGQYVFQASESDGGSSDNCGNPTILVNGFPSFTLSCSNTNAPSTVELRATDGSGNFSTCPTTITTFDTIAPLAICDDVTVMLDASGMASVDSAFADGGSSDACGIESINLSQTAFSCADYQPKYTLYQNNFNRDYNGWNPTDEQTPPGVTLANDVSVWGGVFDEYHTYPADGEDRALTMYKSANGNTIRWKLDLKNTTGDTIKNLDVKYDFEIPWVRFDQTGNFREAQLDWQLQVGGSTTTVHSSPLLNNSSVTSGLATTWLTDAQMDANGLRVTGVMFSIPGIAIDSGETFSIIIGNVGGGVDEKNMNFGIDNLTICAQNPEDPLTMVVVDVHGNVDSCTVGFELTGVDNDGDGYIAECEDCDDNEPLVNPGQPEICGDGLDNNCDGIADDAGVAGYCCASGTNPNSFIQYVGLSYPLGSIVKFVDSGPDNFGYGDYTFPKANIASTYVPFVYFNVKPGLNRFSYIRIWVDWNQNGDFDPYEMMVQQITNTVWNGQLSVPFMLRSIPGEYVMRIGLSQRGYIDDPCEADAPRAEFEDYVICIANGCSGGGNPPIPLTPADDELVNEITDPYTLQVSVRPNPFNDDLVLETTLGQDGDVQIRMLDQQGQTVLNLQTQGQAGLNQTVLQTPHLAAGMYYVQVISGDKYEVLKVIKE